MAVSQEFETCQCSVAGVFMSKSRLKGVKELAAFLSNRLNKCAHAFQEALTKQTEVILVCNWLDLFYL